MKSDSEFAEDIISRAIEYGADQAEVFFRTARSLNIEVKNQLLDSLKSSRTFGYGLRVIKNGCLGFAYSSSLDDAGLVIKSAVDSAAHTDPDWHLDLPEASGSVNVAVYDPMIEKIKEEDAIELAMGIERTACNADPRIRKVRKAAATFTTSERLIINSRSVKALYKSTACSAQIMVVAEDNNDAQSGFDYSGNRFLKNVLFEEVGRNAAENAVRLLGSKRIEAGTMPVILDSSVVAEFLGILAGSMSADSVQKGKSLLSGRLGEMITSPIINITDNGLLPGMLGSSPVDAEGVPVKKKVLIDKGVLQSYLHNTYTANKGSVSSTGNAVRGGFSSLPSVGLTNLYLESDPGVNVVPRDKIYGLIGKGLHIFDVMGIHTANPVSGDFSIGVTGLWIENGLSCYPVKEAVISGNILDLFEKIVAVGDDLRFYGNIGAPSLIISDIDVSA
jgi:PmbA protein